jgi:hypothetical protein
MELLGVANPGAVPADGLTSFLYAVIKISAYAAVGVFLVGIVMVCWRCLFECRKWRGYQGRSVFWPLIH